MRLVDPYNAPVLYLRRPGDDIEERHAVSLAWFEVITQLTYESTRCAFLFLYSSTLTTTVSHAGYDSTCRHMLNLIVLDNSLLQRGLELR
jgi:hypothetical protein